MQLITLRSARLSLEVQGCLSCSPRGAVPMNGQTSGVCRIKQFLSKKGVDFIEQFLLEIA